MSTTFPNGPRTESFILSSTNYSHRNRPYEITQLNHRIQIDYIPRSLSFFKLHYILTDTHTHLPRVCRQNYLGPAAPPCSAEARGSHGFFSQLHADLPQTPRRSGQRAFWSFGMMEIQYLRAANDLVSLWTSISGEEKRTKKEGKRIVRRTIEASATTCQ